MTAADRNAAARSYVGEDHSTFVIKVRPEVIATRLGAWPPAMVTGDDAPAATLPRPRRDPTLYFLTSKYGRMALALMTTAADAAETMKRAHVFSPDDYWLPDADAAPAVVAMRALDNAQTLIAWERLASRSLAEQDPATRARLIHQADHLGNPDEHAAALVERLSLLPSTPDSRSDLSLLTVVVEALPTKIAEAAVTAIGDNGGMVRRPVIVSAALRTPWVSAVTVDNETMLARIPDPGEIFDARDHPAPRQQFVPHDLQRYLNPSVPPIPYDLRLAALADLDPRHGLIDDTTPALAGDVLTLLVYAHAIDRPMIVTEREGAALLARTRKGEFRRPKESDIKRFRLSSAYLRSLALWAPDGSLRWLNMAHVSAAYDPVGGWSVEIGPPSWARPIEGKWTLTAEGSKAARLRPTAGEKSMAGRIITGLEYRLAARSDGLPGVASALRPGNGRSSGPGRDVTIPWREVLHLAGDYWDPADRNADQVALKRFDRAVDSMVDLGYSVANGRAEAPAGDSVEVIGSTRGERSSPALIVRASARFVEAARKAQLLGDAGFEPQRLSDYAGLIDLNDPTQ